MLVRKLFPRIDAILKLRFYPRFLGFDHKTNFDHRVCAKKEADPPEDIYSKYGCYWMLMGIQ